MNRALLVALSLLGCAPEAAPAPVDASLGDVGEAVLKPNGLTLHPAVPPPSPRERWRLRCAPVGNGCDLPPGRYVPVAAGPDVLVWTPSDGRYLNEPTLLRDPGGQWHVISNGADGVGDPWRERSLLHGVAPSLMGPWTALPDAVMGGGLRALWGAHLFADDGGYTLLHYAVLGGDEDRGENRIARSADLTRWTVSPDPLPGGRDGMRLRLADGREALYTTALRERNGQRFDAVTAHVRSPGGAWTERVVLEQTFPCRSACWGFFESPYVIAVGGHYYLFVTYTDSGYATYEQTLVFRSEDPLRFSLPHVAVLRGHGGEVHVEDGRYYLTHGGWPSRIGEDRRGLSVLPIAWAPVE